MELNAVSIDDVQGDLDEQGIERVPMADPGLDVGLLNSNLTAIGHLSYFKRPIPAVGEHPGSEQHGGLHTRRKSVLPGMRTRHIQRL